MASAKKKGHAFIIIFLCLKKRGERLWAKNSSSNILASEIRF